MIGSGALALHSAREGHARGTYLVDQHFATLERVKLRQAIPEVINDVHRGYMYLGGASVGLLKFFSGVQALVTRSDEPIVDQKL